MNKISAADELQRLASLFGSLPQVAEQLREVGSLEQAAREAKAAREAEVLELEKTKSAVKRAKEDFKKQEAALAEQGKVFEESLAKAKEAWELAQKEHAAALQAERDAADADVAAAKLKLKELIAGEKEAVQKAVKEAQENLAKVQADVDAAQAKHAELVGKIDKAKKALAKLGMKFDESTDD